MTSEQYRAALAAIGLNLTTGAAFLGINRATSNRYAKGDWPVPRAIALLLAYAAGKRTTFVAVAACASLYLERTALHGEAEATEE